LSGERCIDSEGANPPINPDNKKMRDASQPSVLLKGRTPGLLAPCRLLRVEPR